MMILLKFLLYFFSDQTKKSGHRLVGDVCYDEAIKVASFITPVPVCFIYFFSF